MFDKFKKDRKMQIGAAIVVALFVVSGYLLFGNKTQPVEEEVVQEQTVQNLTAGELGLTLEAKPDGKAVKFLIAKAKDIESIEYELTYEADSTAQEQSEGGEPRIQRGITGEAEIDGESEYKSEWLDLGSCSRNVCRYDSGVKSIDLTLKIVKEGGKTYQSEKSLEL